MKPSYHISFEDHIGRNLPRYSCVRNSVAYAPVNGLLKEFDVDTMRICDGGLLVENDCKVSESG